MDLIQAVLTLNVALVALVCYFILRYMALRQKVDLVMASALTAVCAILFGAIFR